MYSALFVVAHDSQFKWAQKVAAELRRHGWTVSYLAPSEHAKISEQQMIDVDVDPSEVLRAVGTSSFQFMSRHDAIFFPTPGAITERYIYRIRDLIETEQISKRPILISSYVGLVIDNHTAGFLYRAPADIVCVNSRHDLEIFKAVCSELGLKHKNLLLSGLAVIPSEIRSQKSGPIKKVVFADQLALPKKIEEKRQIYQLLTEYAITHPDREIVVKPRHRPDEGSFHQGKLPPEKFFSSEKIPSNIKIDYTPIPDLLETTDLLITLSSTAALEAIAYGVRTAIISDIGVKEVHGNSMFVGSGLIRSFTEINQDKIGMPALSWVEKFQFAGRDTSEMIAETLQQLLCERESKSLRLPTCPYFKARRDCLFHRIEIKKGKVVPKKPLFEERLKAYGPMKRFFVSAGDRILPQSIASFLDKWLQRHGIL